MSLPVFQLPDMVLNYNLTRVYPLANEVDRLPHQLDNVTLSQKDFWSVNNLLYARPK